MSFWRVNPTSTAHVHGAEAPGNATRRSGGTLSGAAGAARSTQVLGMRPERKIDKIDP